MMMTNKEYFDDELDDYNMCLMETQLYTTEWHAVSTDNSELLLSQASDYLPNRDSTYQLVGDDGLYYSESMTKSELESYIPTFSEEITTPKKGHKTYVSVLSFFADQLRSDGYRIYAHNREEVDSWRVINEQVLVTSMEEKPHIHPFLAFSRVDKEDASYLVDKNGTVVMQKNTEEHFYGLEDGDTFFSIYDKNGDLVISEITIPKLLTVFLCLVADYDVEFIKNNFLRFKDQKTIPIAYDEINFINYVVSPDIDIRSYSDLTKIARLVINDSKPIYSGSYYMWNERLKDCCQNYPIAQNELLATLKERACIEKTPENKRFSDCLIQIAKTNRLEIERRDIYRVRNLFVDQLVYKNNKIVSYINLLLFGAEEVELLNSSYIRPAFRLRNTETGQYIVQDYNIYELANQLFSYMSINQQEA